MIDDFDESTEAIEQQEQEDAKLQEKENKKIEKEKEKESDTVNKGFYIKPKEKFDFGKIVVFIIVGMALIVALLFIIS